MEPHFLPPAEPIFQIPGIVVTSGTAAVLLAVYRAGRPANLRLSRIPPGSQRLVPHEGGDRGWLVLSAAMAIWASFGCLSLLSDKDNFVLHFIQALLSLMNTLCFYTAAGFIDGARTDPGRLHWWIGHTAGGHRKVYLSFVAATICTLWFAVTGLDSVKPFMKVPDFITSVFVLGVYLYDLARGLQARGSRILLGGVLLTFFLQMFVQIEIVLFPFIAIESTNTLTTWMTKYNLGNNPPGGVETTWAASLTSKSLFAVLLVAQAFTWVTDEARRLANLTIEFYEAVDRTRQREEKLGLTTSDDLMDLLDETAARVEQDDLPERHETPLVAGAQIQASSPPSAVEGAWPSQRPIDLEYVKDLLVSHRPISLRVVDMYYGVAKKLDIDSESVRKYLRAMKNTGVITPGQQMTYKALVDYLKENGLAVDQSRLQPSNG